MIRNFYVEVEIDGRVSKLSGGPKSKDGGMYIVLYVRDKGQSVKAVDINCFVDTEGQLKIVETNAERSKPSIMLNGNKVFFTYDR